METKKLSTKIIFAIWGEAIVEWFMDFFADPEYYWVSETYPLKKRSRNKIL